MCHYSIEWSAHGSSIVLKRTVPDYLWNIVIVPYLTIRFTIMPHPMMNYCTWCKNSCIIERLSFCLERLESYWMDALYAVLNNVFNTNEIDPYLEFKSAGHEI